MWSEEFVEVPDETYQKPKSTTKVEAKPVFSTPQSAPQPIPSGNNQADRASEERSVVERLKDFKDPDYLATKEVELGSSTESDVMPMDQIMGQQARKHVPLSCTHDTVVTESNDFRVPEPDLISFDDSDDLIAVTKVESAVDALSELDGEDKPTPPARTHNGNDSITTNIGSEALRTEGRGRDPNSPSSDFVFVTDYEVKDAMKSVAEAVQRYSPHSPRRLLRGLREGTYQDFIRIPWIPFLGMDLVFLTTKKQHIIPK